MEFKHFNRDCPINLKHMFILPMKPSLRGDMWLLHTSLWLSVKLHSLTIMESYILAKNILNTVQFMSHAAAKPLQSCPTLYDPIDGNPPGFPVPGILQARTLEWVAISFSKAWKWKVKVKLLSHVLLFATPLNHVLLFATPWTATHQAPPSMGFSRQEYWSAVPVPSPRGY